VSEQRDYTVSSGNVFADLTVADPEEALAKAKLAHAISEIVARRGWTQARSAEVLGIDQPKISALTRGRLDGFSIERLLRYLTALDYDIEIIVAPKATSGRTARIAVRREPGPELANPE
jgi:predicted XRE-type DNA-binding protein